MGLLPDLSIGEASSVEAPDVEVAPEATPLDFLRAVYMNAELPLSMRMRAAIACLPFETPKLSVVANVESRDFADRLEKAIARSGVRPLLIEHAPAAPRVIEPPQTLAKPMTTSVPDRRMRRV